MGGRGALRAELRRAERVCLAASSCRARRARRVLRVRRTWHTAVIHLLFSRPALKPPPWPCCQVPFASGHWPLATTIERGSMTKVTAGLPLPTHRSRREFSQRTTGLPWNLTLAHAAEKVGDGESGHSRVLADDRDQLGVELLDPMVTNWRCRPSTDFQIGRFLVRKRSSHSVSRCPAAIHPEEWPSRTWFTGDGATQNGPELRCRRE